jgi:uroporphyrinogen-III decarboxylase
MIGKPLSSYYLDHRILVEANLTVREKFELDIVQVISDPYREAADYGLEVEFPEDGLPLRKRPLLTEPAALLKLHKPDPVSGARMSDRIEAVRLLRERVGADVPVMGWVEGALAEANVLRGDTALMLDLNDRPEWVRELLDFCVDLQVEFARRQVEAGADIIGLGDAIASQISPAMYETFALPYEQRIFSAVHEMGALARLRAEFWSSWVKAAPIWSTWTGWSTLPRQPDSTMMQARLPCAVISIPSASCFGARPLRFAWLSPTACRRAGRGA